VLEAVVGRVVGVGLEVWFPAGPPIPPLLGVGVLVASITVISVGDGVVVVAIASGPDVAAAVGVIVKDVSPELEL